MRYFSLFILIIILSCNGQKKTATKDKNDINVGNGKLILLLQDNYSGSDVEETIIIKDEKALGSFFSKINRTRKPGLPVPEVDFTKEMILIHCMGEQINGEHATLSVEEENEKEVIISTFIEKLKKSGTSSAFTSPFSVYKMPLTQKEITFKE